MSSAGATARRARAIVVGAGPGGRAVLEMLARGTLASFDPEIVGVVDVVPDAPGMALARERGLPTYADLSAALKAPGLELVIELTGDDAVLERIHAEVPRGVRVIDHDMAQVFWDLDQSARDLRRQLERHAQLERTISADRRRLQQILDSLPDAVMVLDAAGRIERVNRTFEQVTRIGAGGVLGLRCSERSDLAAHRCRAEECPRQLVMRGNEAVTVVQRDSCLGRPTEGDEEAYYQVSAAPLDNVDGSRSVVVTSREVTEQVLLKRETEEAASRFEQILNSAHSFITIKSRQGRFVVVNRSAAEFLGRRPEELVGRHVEQVLAPADARLVLEHDERVWRQGRHLGCEETIAIQGDRRVLQTERFLLTDYRGEPVSLCCVSNDVTAERRLQQELVQSEKHAAVGKLAAGVAHEINNPLTGILTFAEELQEDLELPPEHRAREDVDVIIRETLRCRQIVRSLLEFSRQKPDQRVRVSLQGIVDRVLRLVGNQASFHDIDLAVEGPLDRLHVRGDPGQLQQVLLNLVINARDAMEGRGNIAIRGRGADGTATLEVADGGCGMDEALQGRIFEPFFSTKGDQGVGLGLAVVRRIVDNHGGRIEVDSAVGRGTTFTVALPAEDGEQAPGRSGDISTRAPSGRAP